MKSLPPLKSLRAFEAAARHLSISKAAIELNVTTGAISQQVKSLEAYLQVKLFIRGNRQIELTETGHAFLAPLTIAFNQLFRAVETVNSFGVEEPLTITGPPSLMSRWLIPRLTNFNNQYPGIDIRIDASTRLVDFDNEKIDLGIRFSMEADPELDSTHFMALDTIAVCCPDLLNQGRVLKEPKDLQHFTLLHFDANEIAHDWPDWSMWLAALEVAIPKTKGDIYFNQFTMLIDALLEGQGVALLSTVLVEKDLRLGNLIKLFDVAVPQCFKYYLVTSPYKANKPNIQVFKRWMFSQL